MTEDEWMQCQEPGAMVAHLNTLPGPSYLRAWVLACRGYCGMVFGQAPDVRIVEWWCRGNILGSPDQKKADRLSMSMRTVLLRDVAGNVFRSVTLPWQCRECGILCGSPAAGYYCVKCGSDEARCLYLTPTVLSLAHAARDYADDRGLLDPVRLAVLADGLIEAGLPESVPCHACKGTGREYDYLDWQACSACWVHRATLKTGHLPCPLLTHLREPGLHCKSCWAVRLIVGD